MKEKVTLAKIYMSINSWTDGEMAKGTIHEI